MDSNKLYEKVLDKWGKESQLLQTAEECNELSKAIIKFVNGRGNTNRIEEEVADVEIMIEQMRTMVNVARVNGHKDFKLKKLEEMIGGK
jgi:NTP pyrophosphatase (non-canonical NTP hydrolase)